MTGDGVSGSTRPWRRRLALPAALCAATLSLASCSSVSSTFAGPPPEPTGPRVTYVAIGGTETLGFGSEDARQAWTQIFYRAALPPRATMYVLASPDATIAGALAGTAALALKLKPTVVTVWFGLTDMDLGDPAGQFAQQTDTLLRELRRNGSTTVLVANLVPLGTPAACGSSCGLISSYDAAIARAAAATGALLVDVHQGLIIASAHAMGTSLVLPGLDGFSPTGQVVVAGLFTSAYRHRHR
jgi:hypothetical protein